MLQQQITNPDNFLKLIKLKSRLDLEEIFKYLNFVHVSNVYSDVAMQEQLFYKRTDEAVEFLIVSTFKKNVTRWKCYKIVSYESQTNDAERPLVLDIYQRQGTSSSKSNWCSNWKMADLWPFTFPIFVTDLNSLSVLLFEIIKCLCESPIATTLRCSQKPFGVLFSNDSPEVLLNSNNFIFFFKKKDAFFNFSFSSPPPFPLLLDC